MIAPARMTSHHIVGILRLVLVHYGYWAVAGALLLENAGLPLPGETILLLASILAYSERTLHLGWIIVIATLAAAIGDNLGYALGLFYGRSLLDRYRHSLIIGEARVAQGERLFERYGAATILFARFLFALRAIAGPMAGILRMPWKKFAAFNLIGAALWVTIISLAGYSFGSQWNRLMILLKRFNLGAAALFVLIALFLYWRSRRRAVGPF
jgi:membrane protein DedA with SNARE-associated domain